MNFRVTQSMLSDNMLNNINSNLGRMQKYQEYMSTGRRINRPSDDPVGFNFAMRYRSELRANGQYQKNVDMASSWLDFTEDLINSVNDIVQRARELAVQGANDTNPESGREAIATEIDQLRDQLVSVANERFQGKYVFNGDRTNQPPYDSSTPENSQPDDGDFVLEVGPGVKMKVNVNGKDVFGEAGSDNNIFKILSDLSAALRDGNTEDIEGVIGRLEPRSDQLLDTLASVGARSRRLELTSNRLQDNELNLQKLLTKTEDVDITAAVTDMKMAENIYLASLSVSARLIQPSLVDFLK